MQHVAKGVASFVVVGVGGWGGGRWGFGTDAMPPVGLSRILECYHVAHDRSVTRCEKHSKIF